MKKFYTRNISAIFFCLLASFSSRAQLTVDSTFSPTLLVTTLLGGGITASNITYTGDTFHASGFFNEPSNAFGVTNGIMLTTGSVSNAPGPNNSDMAQYDNLLPGDPLLNLYTDTTLGTYDACVLEFDFTSISDSIEFNYVFASEEYNEYVFQGFNDVFGFFISGPGIVGQQNIALVPGTNTPCSIDSINNGYTMVGQASTGPCTNCQYYVDNFMGTVMQYDGYTTVLTARAGVIPCETYHIKLAIEDVSDGVYDSGVFLQGGSFKSSGIFQVIYNGGDAPGSLPLCPGTCATLTAPFMYSYNWNTGDTTQTISACTPGIYYVSTTNGACSATSSSVNVVAVTGPPAVTISNAFHVLSSSITDTSYSYQWYLGGIPFPGAASSTFPLTVSGCYHLVITDVNGCTSVSDTICDMNVGVEELSLQQMISVRPNPSAGTFTIQAAANTGSGEIFLADLSGKIVYSKKWNANTTAQKVDAADFAKGIYFLQLKTDLGVYTQRLVLE